MSIGTITPPVGTVLFILSRITGIPIERLSKELIPWYGALMFVVFLCIFFPSIVTFIPNLLSQ
jgi:TRAP-type C4-dicarboxylate transport system permease large subunit